MVLAVPRVVVFPRRGLGAPFSPPVNGPISSDFGPRAQPTAGASTDHKGIDYAVPVGTPVSASAAGRVSFAGQQSGFGNIVQVDHGGGIVSSYAHLSQISVSVGQQVAAGQLLGLSGATGTVTGPNLHFGIALNGTAVDPESYLVQASLPNVVPPVDQVAADDSGFLPASADSFLSDPLALGVLAGVVGLTILAVVA